MAKFLTTNAVSLEIENIIKGASKKVALISPYLKLSQNLFERLQDADRRNVVIMIIYGKESLAIEQLKLLSELKNLELYYYKNLHAKCYLNEQYCVITSMNMYEFSEKNNREMGILISKSEDGDIFKDTTTEISFIKNSSTKQSIENLLQKEEPPKPLAIKPNKTDVVVTAKKEVKQAGNKPLINQLASSVFGGLANVASHIMKSDGTCIRCAVKIKHDLDKPLCLNCFQAWRVYENVDYPEAYCHSCGKKHKTSVAKPECRNCYQS